MMEYRSYNRAPILGEFFTCSRLCISAQKQHQIPAYVLPNDIGFIVLLRKNANPYLQNTYKSPIVLVQKIVLQKTFNFRR